MAQVNDLKFQALRGQGFTGGNADMTLAWLQAAGATSGSVSDAWGQMLSLRGYPIQGGWYELLGDLGFEGALNDRALQFWESGGVLPPV